MIEQLKDIHQKREESIDLLMQVWVRFILAFSGLIILFVDPLGSGRSAKLAYTLLTLYCLYSSYLIFDMYQMRGLASKRAIHWIDVAFCSCLIALTGGGNSIFFLFFFFTILVASFSWGFKEGLAVTGVAAFMFALSGILTAGNGNLDQALTRPIYLFGLGYMIAYWGGGKILLKRRLWLLQEISTNWNPRFGANHAIGVNLGRLLEFCGGTSCILVTNRTDAAPKYVMYVADRQNQSNSIIPREIAETTARELLVLPDSLAVAYGNLSMLRLTKFNKFIAYDVNTLERIDRFYNECKTLANLFDGQSFISVPYLQHGITAGRIYLVAGNRVVDRSDIAFTWQVARAISAVVENMLLIEHLITEAAEHERHRISRDVHDTTVQPYIGLTLALGALAREFIDNDPLSERIGEIINMANMTIRDLRSYTDTLREKSPMRSDFLISAVKSQAERLVRFYGINVAVKGDVAVNLNGRLAEEAFQIIAEGLSNILRHTSAKRAFVSIQCKNDNLLLEIGNEVPAGPSSLKHFQPRSIHERSLALKGTTLVEYEVGGYTVVRVTIPLIKDQFL